MIILIILALAVTTGIVYSIVDLQIHKKSFEVSEIEAEVKTEIEEIKKKTAKKIKATTDEIKTEVEAKVKKATKKVTKNK